MTNFQSEHFVECPPHCQNIPSIVLWFSSKTGADSESIIVSRSYSWTWFPVTSKSKWRYQLLNKDEVRDQQPVLYMLQGFSSIPMWGPSQNPMSCIRIQADMPAIPYVCV